MILSCEELADLLEGNRADPLVITPQPEAARLRASGSAAIDLRLGTWFVVLRQARNPILSVLDESAPGEEHRLTKMHYVPFGGEFVLHPRSFVLGVTLEWVRLPRNLAGYVIGRSSWGRRGLVIATAAGVHPGFTGCLTLELGNIGEVPIGVKP